MRRKLLALAALLSVSVPLMAHAWQLGVRVQSAGGSAAINGGSAITNTTGTVFKTYTTTAGNPATKSVTVTKSGACNTIAKVVRNGVTILAPASPYSTTFTYSASQQSLLAYFTTAKTTVTPSVAANGGGLVSPTAPSFFNCGSVPTKNIVYTFTTATGKTLTGITIDGNPVTVGSSNGGIVRTGIADGASGSAVVTISPAVATAMASGNHSLVATYNGVVANAGDPQTIMAGGSVTLTATGGTLKRWSSSARPSGAAQPFAAANGSFTQAVGPLSVVGQYVFKYTAEVGVSAQTTVTVVNSFAAAARIQCYNCHSANGVATQVFANWSTSNAKANGRMCYDCHAGAGNGGHPGTVGNDCIGCHDVEAPNHGGNVADNANNAGVRSVVQEFTKWSHHVTGVNLQNAHCAACHLEGKAVSGAIVIDKAYHMADATVHLRHAQTDAEIVWDPASPNHTSMDQFCMSCHSAAGFSSPKAAAIQAIMVPAAGLAAAPQPSNPFMDTISNRYDKMKRPAVVNVDGQFDTTNNSHHAVKGQRYTGKSRSGASRVIASPGTFANTSTANPTTLYGKRSTIYDSVNSITGASEKATNPAFNPLYSPLGTVVPPTAATELGDDSTLHCGDCHTVGQWKPNVATNAAGVLNTVAIGAHGSSNEYLLRNDKGTDFRHSQDAYITSVGIVIQNKPNAANLVCFNCHAYKRYGSVYSATGTAGPHVGEYDASGRCNSQANTIPFNGYTTGTATDGTQFGSRFLGPLTKYAATAAYAPGFPLDVANAPTVPEVNPDFGNTLGIQCANCHNSGAGNAYGGIHGSKNNQTTAGFTNDPSVTGGSFINGMGNTSKILRFLPGLGDAMHTAGTLGGVTGGSVVKFKNYSAYSFAMYSAVSSSNRRTKGYFPTRYFEMPIRANHPANPLLNYSASRPTSGLPTYTARVVNVANGLGYMSGKAGSYNITTGGVMNDTNWEQIGWKQIDGTLAPNSNPNLDTAYQAQYGAGCYTLGNSTDLSPGTRNYAITDTRWSSTLIQDDGGNTLTVDPNIMDALEGPSQGVAGQPTPELIDNWGGCDDHSAPKGGGNHGFIKRILRPATY